MNRSRTAGLAAALLAVSGSGLLTSVALASPASASPTGCTPVVTSKGDRTAALVDPTVAAGTVVDATGCDIGVYYNLAGNGDTLSGVTVENATQYGVFVDDVGGPVNVNVTDDHITNIGDHPFDGVQYGVGIYYYGFGTAAATGTIDGNTIDQYQKGGIVVNGSQASATVTNNQVTGLGPVNFIAQNGIQFGFGATPLALSGNTVTGNHYVHNNSSTPAVSAGLLFYKANITGRDIGRYASSNHVYQNQANISY